MITDPEGKAELIRLTNDPPEAVAIFLSLSNDYFLPSSSFINSMAAETSSIDAPSSMVLKSPSFFPS